ncbi:uncharacterized membrane protein YuiD-like isoform X1 [Vigna umbellata]|uniref:uncharacterized membrane protein YuiD-like isoform X1 n=1 Tax=Vigna umbellata TaxID=87088 RepID=UPI001F5FB700|nr:uncharacterized membrane protein YuiD-like isoform X1 [Vigna umbellata]
MDEVMTMADVAANTQGSTTASSSLPSNFPLISAFLSFALAQFLKIFTTWCVPPFLTLPPTHQSVVITKARVLACFNRIQHVTRCFTPALLISVFSSIIRVSVLCIWIFRYKEKRWDSKRMLDSGGMPSSHSATVSALAVAIGLQEGAGSSAFAVAVVLACIVMYDASGVRLHAGRQAELLNQIVCELPPEHPLSNVRPLRDSLGHTPFQVVAGGVLGCIIAFLMRKSN